MIHVGAALALLASALSWPFTAAAIDQLDAFEDPQMQARYERLTNELRCLVCQNQTIADSNAELAQDLRKQTRDMLASGASDAEIKAFMTERYGDFVLYKPPVKATTLLLWLAPGLLLLGGLFVTVRIILGRAGEGIDDLADADGEPARGEQV
jgi:cytochrome c-type biogenesis protein CcmH